MLLERGLSVDHTTIFRWVQKYAPEIYKRICPHLKLAGASCPVDESYIKVGKNYKYLCESVVENEEKESDCQLSPSMDHERVG
jgi:transposase-like protein